MDFCCCSPHNLHADQEFLFTTTTTRTTRPSCLWTTLSTFTTSSANLDVFDSQRLPGKDSRENPILLYDWKWFPMSKIATGQDSSLSWRADIRLVWMVIGFWTDAGHFGLG